MNQTCAFCNNSETKNLHGYNVCQECKKSLRLFDQKTVSKYISELWRAEYKAEVEKRIEKLDQDYLKKRIKLLDIQNKIKH